MAASRLGRFVLLVVGLVLLSLTNAFADVTVTPATGGTNLSSDTAPGGLSPAWTSLTAITISEKAGGPGKKDFSQGIGVTLVLKAPAGFEFNTGQAPGFSYTGGQDITSMSVAVTDSATVTVTLTVSDEKNNDSLSINGLQVRPTATSPIAVAGDIFRPSTGGGTVVMSGLEANGTSFGALSQSPGAFRMVQILVPGETAAPGTPSGKTGTPSPRTAGTAFNVTVNAVDAYWNLASANHTAGITSSDANATPPASAALVAGTRQFSVTLKTAGIRTVTATDITDGTKTANTSPPITVNAGAFTKMQLLVPGETGAPGTASGKTGTPTAQVSGAGFGAIVNAVDANWNLVTSVTNVVAITSSDGTASLPGNTPLVGGTQTSIVTLRAAGSRTVTASDATQGGHTPNTSPGIQVLPSATVSGFVYGDANRNSVKDGAETGSGLVLFAKIYPAGTPSGPAQQVVTVNPGTGAFSFLTVTNGTYFIALDDNNTQGDVTPTLPAGWVGTEIQNQLRSNVVASGVDLLNQNFGLIQVATVRGVVFSDMGVGGGVANDGVKNGTEPGLSGVLVRLLDGGGGVLDSATTDGGGNYVLIVPGSVAGGASLTITEASLSAYRSTGATVGNTGGVYNPAGDFVSFTYASGASYSGVNFGDVPENQFTSASPKSASAGSVVFYTHAFTAGSAGQVTLTSINAPSPANSGWSNTLYRDTNCNGQIDSGEMIISGALTMAADEKLCLIVKEVIPANAPFNAQDQITITAQFAYTGSNPPVTALYTRADLTTVGTPTAAGLALTKAVDKSTAFPGETITYTITYSNSSAAMISNVIVFDSTPAFTTFLTAATGPLPPALTGSVIVKPAVAGRGPIRWTFSGSLNPGQSGTVSFSVVIE